VVEVEPVRPGRAALVLLRAALVGTLLVATSPSRSEPIPLEAFFSEPELSRLTLSPDGSHIAAAGRVGDAPALVVLDAAANEVVSRTPFPGRRIASLLWANDERVLVGVEIGGGTKLFAVDRDGSDRKAFAGPRSPGRRSQYQDRIASLLPSDPRSVLIAYDWTPRGARILASRVFRLNVYDGRTQLVSTAKKQAREWLADADGVLRLGVGWQGEELVAFYREGPDRDWFRLSFPDGPIDPTRFMPLAPSPDPRRIYVRSRHESDRFAIYLYDVRERTFSPTIFRHPDVDVTGPFVFSPDDGRLIGVGYAREYPEIHWLDARWRRRMLRAREQLSLERLTFMGASDDGAAVLALATHDTRPGTWFVLRENADRPQRVAEVRPELEGRKLSPQDRVVYTARDGLEISGYLTLPADGPRERLPLVVNPHGGPWARDVRGFDPEVQLFASRGWAVFRPNFRGSTGFGREFERKGYAQYGLAMQDDVTDGVRWLIAQGVADPERVCIYGTSYGGYAAIQGLVATPELYRCGAAYAGLFDLAQHLKDRRRSLLRHQWEERLGDRERDRERLQATSPLHHVRRIRVPVFVAHGDDDHVVHPDQTRRLAAALDAAGRPHELLILEDEGHALAREQNRLAFYRRLEAFLARHLAKAPEGAVEQDAAQGATLECCEGRRGRGWESSTEGSQSSRAARAASGRVSPSASHEPGQAS